MKINEKIIIIVNNIKDQGANMRGILILLGLILVGAGFGALVYEESRAMGLMKTQPYEEYAIPLFVGGAVLILVGLFTGGRSQSKSSSGGGTSGVKRKVVVKPGAQTAKCPVCQFPIDVTTQTEGVCPKCKNDIEVFFEG